MIKKVFIVVIILISISIVCTPLYNLARGNKIGLLANYYHELPIELTISDFPTLKIIDNFEAFANVTPTSINYTNRNGFNKTCDLILMINKKSNIDYNNIVVSLNNNIMYLSDVSMEYDEEYYYFNLGSKEISAYSESKDYFRMWLKKDSTNLYKNSLIKMNFTLK